MIDFRYHLVSLVSVFVALAVGIILGAGPLQASLGNILSNQVESLRADLATQRAKDEVIAAHIKLQDEYVNTSAPHAVAAKLKASNVALVTMAGSDPDDVTRVAAAVKAAGGTVVQTATLSEKCFNPQAYPFRQTYSTQLITYLGDKAGGDNAPNVVLGKALAVALTTSGSDAQMLWDILAAKDAGIVSFDHKLEKPAKGIIVIGPRSVAPADTDSSENNKKQTPLEAQVQAMQGINFGAPSVFLGDAVYKTDLVWALRDSSDSAKFTTVDSLQSSISPFSATLALAEVLGGGKGKSYGVAHGANNLVPSGWNLGIPVAKISTPATAPTSKGQENNPAPAPATSK